MFAYAFTFLAALAVTFILTPAVKNFAVQIGAVDKPDARKVHHGLVPRLGGLAIYAGFMVSVILTVGFTYEMTGIMIGATCLVFVGIADDIVSLPAKVKLLGQILSAAVLVIFFDVNIDWIDLPYVGIIEFPLFISIPLTIFWIIGFINTVNLIDGLDGLAAGIATIASIAIALLAFQMGQWVSAAAMVAMTGACLGFLQYNFNPAKIFMGDTGSLTLGYTLSFLAIKYSQHNTDIMPYTEGAFLIAFSTMIIPAFDVVRVVLVRIREGHSPFEPDKNHIHHKLLAIGLSPRRAMLSLLSMSCAFSAANILLVPYINNTVLLIADIVIWIGLNLWWDYLRDRK